MTFIECPGCQPSAAPPGGFNFKRGMDAKEPASLFLLDQLIRYGLSADFAPQAALAADYWKGRVRR